MGAEEDGARRGVTERGSILKKDGSAYSLGLPRIACVPSFPASMARKKTAPKGKKPASTTATASAKPSSKTYSGTTTEVVAELIDDGDKVGVLKVIERLELEIKKLQLDLAKAKDSRGRHSEGVTREQLGLLFDELAALREQGERSSARDEQDTTDDTLQRLAALDAEAKEKAKNPPKPPSRPMRREYSPSLLRVDNVLAVPCDQHTRRAVSSRWCSWSRRSPRSSTTSPERSSCAVTSARCSGAARTTARSCVAL